MPDPCRECRRSLQRVSTQNADSGSREASGLAPLDSPLRPRNGQPFCKPTWWKHGGVVGEGLAEGGGQRAEGGGRRAEGGGRCAAATERKRRRL